MRAPSRNLESQTTPDGPKLAVTAEPQAPTGSILGLEGGALEGHLSSKVEAAVHDLRRATPAAVNGIAHGGAASPLAPAPAA